MKCLNCGSPGEQYLCRDCTTEDVLDKIFNEIMRYSPEKCENPYIAELAAGFTEKYAERDIVPEILDLFDSDVTEYYYCRYYRRRRDSRFEDAAAAYLKTHALSEKHTQHVLHDLIESYIPNDFIKPKSWCETIATTDDLCCELYADAAQYFAMIGEYDLSDSIADKAIEICNDEKEEKLLLFSYEGMIKKLNEQKGKTNNYRTKKPYWPRPEERRRAIAMFYDERGIEYPRIENRPEKVKENEFAPIKECDEEELINYCAFWCNEAFVITAAKPIYEIAGVKVSNEEIVDSFESFVRPWDGGSKARQDAAGKAKVPVSVIESAEDVDLVMQKFFEFAGDDVLVSTGALGNQGKLISRAARYTGMREIKNEFYDLLDLAADKSEEFDFDNNKREYILSYFSLTEGESALEKAHNNQKMYELLKRFDE